MNIDLKLGKLSEHRYDEDLKPILEITASAYEARDLEETQRIHERERFEELKKREKGKDRQSELPAAIEMVNRLAEEKELRRKIAAGRRSTTPPASQEDLDEFEDKEDWRGKEEDELRRNTNPHRSPTGPHGVLEAFTDDDEGPLRRSKMRTAQQKVSSTPLHFEETEDQPIDEEKSPPPKKGPNVARKPQIPPGSPSHEVDDLMVRFRRPLTSDHGSSFNSPMYYGYGGGVPGTVVNTGVGNITGTIISNVGNDNSVKKVNRKCRYYIRDNG